MRYLLRGLIFLMLSTVWTPFARGAVVSGVNKSKNRVKLYLSYEEVGLFHEGDSVRGIVRGWTGEFQGQVFRMQSDDIVYVQVKKGFRLPTKGARLDLIPTYRAGWRDGGNSWRGRDGANQFDERYFVAAEVGNGIRRDMFHMGGRLGFFLTRKSALSLHFSLGEYLGSLANVYASMGSLRYSYFIWDSFHTFTALGARRIDVTAVVDSGIMEDADNGAYGPDGDQFLYDLSKKHNYSVDGYAEFGLGNKFAFTTTQLGNVFLIGFDWIVLQQVIGHQNRSEIMDEYLNNRFSMDEDFNYYHRAYMGFSF